MTKKTTKKLSVVKKQPTAIDTTVHAETLIAQAIQQGTSVETMEKLLSMRRELKAERAKEIYDEAMSGFQSECPVIKKTKSVRTKGGQVAYSYAPIDSIVNQVKKYLKKYGFSYSTQIISGKGVVKAVCIVKHLAGYSENYEMEVPLGTKTAVMSDSQVVAAASTFAKRYAFCNAFGILTGDEDNDGVKIEPPTPKKLSNKQAFEQAKKGIATGKNPNTLIDIDKRIQKTELYTDKQKEELHGLISSKVDELNKVD